MTGEPDVTGESEGAADPAQDVLAIEIGRAVIKAHRTATQIVSEAQVKAEGLLRSVRAAGGRSDEYRNQEISRLSEMLRELDRVEEELRDRQSELRDYLQQFLTRRSGRVTS